MPTVADFETALHREIGAFRYDPLGFVMFAFPWGIPHTPLAGETGPEEWQREVLVRIGNGLVDGHFNPAESEAVRVAIASGHGIGKSALVAWIILWAMSTLRDTRGVVSANTEGQLRTKTWPELAKWLAMSRNKEWFTYTATALHSAEPGRDRTWRVDAITWSEQNTEAIAGLHNKGRRAFALLDEASAIPDAVWDTVEGALTDADTELLWAVFGNPTRNTGRFRECFAGGRFAHRWSPKQIDSRSVAMTNKAQIAAWVKDHGEDSDFIRVRVRGVFPRTGSQQFQSVIRFRRGLDARSIPAVKFRIPDLMQVASRVMEQVNSYNPDAVFIDGTGIGWGVLDRLNQLGCRNAVGVDFGGRADRTDASDAAARYANKHAEMWGFMKEWVKAGSLPDDTELTADLKAVDYGYDASDAILLECKDDMRRRGLASPDDGDALALTFAYPVAKRDWAEEWRFREGVERLRRMIR